MFITFEGIEGSGKSTAISAVAGALEQKGRTVMLTREPGGSDLGTRIREILLAQDYGVSKRAEMLLFLADRAQHVDMVMRPALGRGEIVLCDRYADSFLAYQGGGRGLDLGTLARFNAFAVDGLVPDRTLLLDLPVPEGLARASARNSSAASEETRFDNETLQFHEAVRANFLALAKAEPGRFRVINAMQEKDSVRAQCLSAIADLL